MWVVRPYLDVGHASGIENKIPIHYLFKWNLLPYVGTKINYM